MAYDAQRPVGCIYVEVNPPHLVHSEKQPVFGWLEAGEPVCGGSAVECRENYVFEYRGNSLRGPINHPKLFGGLGCLVTATENRRW